MCLSETHRHLPPPLVRDQDDAKTFTNTLDTMASRPSWTLRGVFKPTNTARPGLPRRFHTKINLNEYWGALEKLVKVEVSFPTRQQQQQQQTMDVDNEVNDNIANERAEQRMEVDDEVTEADKEADKEMIPVKQVHVVDLTPVLPPPVKVTPEKLTWAKKTPEKVTPPKVRCSPAPSPRKERRRRPPQGSQLSSPLCGPLSSACTPAASPRRRTPLGTINGLESRAHLNKNLSPLSTFADNLARRLARQY